METQSLLDLLSYVGLCNRAAVCHLLDLCHIHFEEFSPPPMFGAGQSYTIWSAKWETASDQQKEVLALTLLKTFLEDCAGSSFVRSVPGIWQRVAWLFTFNVKFELFDHTKQLIVSPESVVRTDRTDMTQLWKDAYNHHKALIDQFVVPASGDEAREILAAIDSPQRPTDQAHCGLSDQKYIKWLHLKWDEPGILARFNHVDQIDHSRKDLLREVTIKLLDMARECIFYRRAPRDVVPGCKFLRVEDYLVLKMDAGITLQTATKTTSLSQPQWNQCVLLLLNALNQLALANIIHRDIHAANILIHFDADGNVDDLKLLDGGEAVADAMEGTTRVGSTTQFRGLGMTAIRSPEIWEEPGRTAAPTDWYAGAATMTMKHPDWRGGVLSCANRTTQLTKLRQFWLNKKNKSGDNEARQRANAMLSLLEENPENRNLDLAIDCFK